MTAVMAARITTGRRIPVISGSWTIPERPGDYCGPVIGNGFYEVVYFLLPIARDEDAPAGARAIQQVHFPPHDYRECEDGSLEIRASIAVYNRDVMLWHGFLDEGHQWREL